MMTKRIYALSLLVFFGLNGLLWGQSIQNRFGYLNINKGLSHNTVNCILKDSRGLMWFGTNEGLNRFDGYQFMVYKNNPGDQTTIHDNRIYAIEEDPNGNLWIGTRKGLNQYHRKSDSFIRYYLEDTISNYFVKSIWVDVQRKGVWIGVLGRGLYFFSFGMNTLEPVTSWNQQLFDPRAGNNVSSVIGDSRGRLLLGNNAAGLNVLNPDNGEVTYYPFVEGDKGLDNLGKTIYEDHYGTIWVCTEGNGLYRFVEPENYFIHYPARSTEPHALSNNIVKDICQDQNGLYWIATDGGGLNIYDPSTRRFQVYRYNISLANSISSNAIYTLFPDSTGTIWIGTFGGGVNVYDPNVKRFELYTQTGKNRNELSHPSVLSFCEDLNHNVWIGTDGGGVNVFNAQEKSFRSYRFEEDNPHSIGSNVVTSIYQDREGGLWFGTYSGGLNFFDQHTRRFRRYVKDPLNPYAIKSNNVWTMYEDSRGTFWVGTLEGLNVFEPSSGRFVEFVIPGTEKVYSEKVTTILEDSHGRLWLGGAFLAILDLDSKEISFPNDGLIKGFDIRSIIEDSRQQIWVGTEGGGLARYLEDQNTFEIFTQDHGLPGNAVHAIVEDSCGYLWISTNMGLSKFNPADTTFRNYDWQDGLQSNQFSYNAALQAHDGKIYFGGVNGFNVFRPDSIHDNKVVPPVILTDFRLMNRTVTAGRPGSPLKSPIGETDEIVLNYSQSVITLSFAALNYTSPEKNQYAYILEGFDQQWNYVGNQRSATYTNLNPGDYLFRVKASNNDGVWNEEGVTLAITILPPWWRTGWAYAGYALLMFGILFSFRNYLLNQQRLKNALALKELEKRKLEEINQVKLKFYTNISHEFRTPLTLITGPLQKLMQTFDGADPIQARLKLIYRNAMRLSRLINQIMDFRKIETGNMTLEITCGDFISYIREIKQQFDPFAADHQIEYTFKSSCDELLMCFDRSKVEIIVFNLLSNAFKFTPDQGRITLSLELEPGAELLNSHKEGDWVVLRVQDSGIGIKPENLDAIFERFYQVNDLTQPNKAVEQHGTGIGLALIKECVALHNGQVNVQSEYGQGSIFQVRLPVVPPDPQISAKAHGMTVAGLTGFELDGAVDMDSESDQDEMLFASRKPVILVVEDNRDMRFFIKDTLNNDFTVALAEDGQRGLDMAFELIPDLIVSDVLMPVMGGFEMAQKLRKDERTSHIPIIFLSAINTLESNLTGLKLGAEDYIEKPFHADVLLAKINNHIESRKRFQERVRMELLSTPREVILESPEEVFLNKAIELVEEHMADSDFDVRLFYTRMGLSRSVLYRKLEAITGQSVNEFVRSIRLKRAASLLKQNKLSVSEISYEVGFSDPQYFSKCFRKAYGTSPSKYAEQTGA